MTVANVWDLLASGPPDLVAVARHATEVPFDGKPIGALIEAEHPQIVIFVPNAVLLLLILFSSTLV